MPRALPGAKCPKRDAGLVLEQMQEARWRQLDRCGAVGRGHLAAGEIIEHQSGASDAMIDVAIGQTLVKRQLVEFRSGKTATPLLPAQGLVSGTNALRDGRRLRSANSGAQAFHGRGLDRFRFDHEANDRGMLAFNAVGHVRPNQRHFTDHLGLALGDLEASLHRNVDVEATAGPFSRPAQQARIKHPLGADQHQPPRITAIPVVHGSSLPGAISGSCRVGAGLSQRSYRQNTEFAPDVTDDRRLRANAAIEPPPVVARWKTAGYHGKTPSGDGARSMNSAA